MTQLILFFCSSNGTEYHGPARRRDGTTELERREFLLRSITSILFSYAPNAVAKSATGSVSQHYDAVVVGSGLAGLVSALTILDRGGRVAVLEKEPTLGGNSRKASSGINGLSKYAPPGDSLDLFEQDTYKSHNEPSAQAKLLIDTLVENSESALQWLEMRLKVDISQVAQLGGHSHPRTHRPRRGMVGATLMTALFEELHRYEENGRAAILSGSKAESLISKRRQSGDDASVVGVRYRRRQNGNDRLQEVLAQRTILAAGGFAASKKLLQKFSPQFAHLPTTSGPYATGDGVLLATAVGAAMADMSKVQIHPTGWVDPADPDGQSKVLAAEVLRGLGGVLFDRHGRRFCNELGTRKYISETMLAMPDNDVFYLVLGSSARLAAAKHVNWYEAKGLMQTLDGIDALAEYMHVSKDVLRDSLRRYEEAASQKKVDEYNKSVFVNAPGTDLQNEVFCAGRVTPVIHYCMGGLAMNPRGQVLKSNGRTVIPGLFAAGEVTGGLHGDNRLGGNSLLECTVFGRIIGEDTPIASRSMADDTIVKAEGMGDSQAAVSTTREVTLSELEKHNTANDCWVAIDGRIFDLTDFAKIHPGGSDMIQKFAGKDGSQIFDAVHAPEVLDSPLARRYQVGVLAGATKATVTTK